jgi:hypothetical protein
VAAGTELAPAVQGGRPSIAEPIFGSAVIAAFAAHATRVQINGETWQAIQRGELFAEFKDKYIARTGSTTAAAERAFQRLLKTAVNDTHDLAAANVGGVTWLQQVM